MIGRTNSKCAGSGGGNTLYSTLLTETCMWKVPVSGFYEIHIVGSGGKGGNGGLGDKVGSSTSSDGWTYRLGAGGGGGGSGAHTAGRYSLDGGTDINITIGSANGTIFGASGDEYYMVAGNGSVGGNGEDFRARVGGVGGAGGIVTVAGNLLSESGKAGTAGAASDESESSSWNPKGGTGGKPTVYGLGRGGDGGYGCVEHSSIRNGLSSKPGGVYVTLLRKD